MEVSEDLIGKIFLIKEWSYSGVFILILIFIKLS